MEFTFASIDHPRPAAAALVIPFWKEEQGIQVAVPLPFELPHIDLIFKLGDFNGKEGEIVCVYDEQQPEARLLFLGMGAPSNMTVDTLRRIYGSLVKMCISKKITSLNILVPEISLKNEDLITGIAEGLLLPNYLFDGGKTQEDSRVTLIEKVTWIAKDKQILDVANRTLAICEGVYFARDLVNSNADDVTPLYLADCAKELAKKYKKIKTTVFDLKQIQKEGLHLLLAVNRGSALEPAFIIMNYNGHPTSKDHTVLIGKGVTYDTGGLNIKTAGMETMRCDMGGAAVCIGTLIALANLKAKINVTAVIPTTENCTDAKSFKPGDVYKSYSGQTVEMTNSDAEGRLILADALAYACKHLEPTRIIDFATLTGAIDIAIGPEASGLMATDDQLAEQLIQAGYETQERVWRMPLFDDYKERLKSDIADLKSWNGRTASACVAATFLRHFVTPTIPWAHLDIASTAFLNEPRKYLPKYATGVCIRLMVQFFHNLGAL